ncbi:hypothetical protein FRC11_012570 [Ceratobasidium sp. 423]|nr:hypothetical protein FRC11_012570 [Ceratobasidium sp. 423]
MADQLPTVLTTDHLIQLAHVECLHRPRAALVARKLGEEISPCNRCLVYTKYGAWEWEQGQGQGQGGDNGALAAHDTAPPQNGIEDEQEDPSSQSSTATLKVTDERFRACDAVLFYACLPYDLDPANGFPEPSDQWPRVPVALFEAKTNASRQLGGEQRSAELAIELEKAREQLGEQVCISSLFVLNSASTNRACSACRPVLCLGITDSKDSHLLLA